MTIENDVTNLWNQGYSRDEICAALNLSLNQYNGAMERSRRKNLILKKVKTRRYMCIVSGLKQGSISHILETVDDKTFHHILNHTAPHQNISQTLAKMLQNYHQDYQPR